MKRLSLSLYLILLVFSASTSFAWTFSTPAGIRIKAAAKAILQYEALWGSSWNDVDWERLDQIFFALREHYHSELPPSKISVKIQPWSPDCVDEIPGSREMKSPWGCIDGYFSGAIVIHLGDDPARGPGAWCDTAFAHELVHEILKSINHPCWAKIDNTEENPECAGVEVDNTSFPGGCKVEPLEDDSIDAAGLDSSGQPR